MTPAEVMLGDIQEDDSNRVCYRKLGVVGRIGSPEAISVADAEPFRCAKSCPGERSPDRAHAWCALHDHPTRDFRRRAHDQSHPIACPECLLEAEEALAVRIGSAQARGFALELEKTVAPMLKRLGAVELAITRLLSTLTFTWTPDGRLRVETQERERADSDRRD